MEFHKQCRRKSPKGYTPALCPGFSRQALSRTTGFRGARKRSQRDFRGAHAKTDFWRNLSSVWSSINHAGGNRLKAYTPALVSRLQPAGFVSHDRFRGARKRSQRDFREAHAKLDSGATVFVWNSINNAGGNRLKAIHQRWCPGFSRRALPRTTGFVVARKRCNTIIEGACENRISDALSSVWSSINHAGGNRLKAIHQRWCPGFSRRALSRTTGFVVRENARSAIFEGRMRKRISSALSSV